MRLSCRRYRYWLSDYYLGEVGRAERGNMEKHIHACPSCAREAEFTKHILNLFAPQRKQPPIEITEEMSQRLWARVVAGIQEEERRENLHGKTRLMVPLRRLALAATV